MQNQFNHSRRNFLINSGIGVGAAAMTSLFGNDANLTLKNNSGVLPQLHFPAKAKRVIFLCMAEGPSHVDLFDYKPLLKKLEGQNLADHLKIPRLSGMTSGKKTFPITPSMWEFKQHGKCGAWVSELLPHTAKIVDDLTFIKSMTSTHVNHDPALTFMTTGHQFPGRPSMGSWWSYGLGTMNKNLPDYVVLTSQGDYKAAQPLLSRFWGSGFLPSKHQGIKFRSGENAVFHLNDPAGNSLEDNKVVYEALKKLNKKHFDAVADEEIQTRIAQYEMAFNMQTSVPDLTNFADEPESTYKLYGEDAKKPGTFASNCLMARRMIERDVRFVQLFHTGWDHHDSVSRFHPVLCKETDQACAGLITDLKQRGLLKDTLVVWGGEFGRTVFSQGGDLKNYGRDHHPYAFTYWMAGAGLKPGVSYGQTDEFGSFVVDKPTDFHDLHATMLHLMGIDHEKLSFKFQGRYFRLTDVHGKILKDIIS